MKRLVKFESFEFSSTFDYYRVKDNNRLSTYYFKSDNNWLYEVGFSLAESEKELLYFTGFKAKREDHFYDMNVMTNDNIYKVMSTIIKILYEHLSNYKPAYQINK